MCLPFEWLLWQAALFLNFLSKHLGVNVKWRDNQLQRNHLFNGIRYGKFSEGSHSLKKMNLQKLIAWVNIWHLFSLVNGVFDKIFKTFSWIILMNSTLEHDMQFPTSRLSFQNKLT